MKGCVLPLLAVLVCSGCVVQGFPASERAADLELELEQLLIAELKREMLENYVNQLKRNNDKNVLRNIEELRDLEDKRANNCAQCPNDVTVTNEDNTATWAAKLGEFEWIYGSMERGDTFPEGQTEVSGWYATPDWSKYCQCKFFVNV